MSIFGITQPQPFMRRILPVVIALLLSHTFFSQADSTRRDTIDIYEMSIEELMKLKAHGVPTEMEKQINALISVASKKPLSSRESPSIVTLVTKEEIRNSGARDLIDVLRMVPGLDFGVDVEGVVGIGVRGNWAHEGKMLLLVDGQEMNEIFFATTQFGNHYPIDNIERIEVIRGPGSAIYGGFAEYGVINIITKKGGDINGVSVSGIYGQTGKNFSTDWLRRNINVSVGKKFGDKPNDFEFSVSGILGQGSRSDRHYNDLYGDTLKLNNGNSNLNPRFVNVGMSYKNFSVRAIGDFYNTTVRDAYDVATTAPYVENYKSLFGEIKYLWKINDKFTLTPKVNIKNQSPWNTAPVPGVTEAYNKSALRTLGNLTLSYQINRKINFVFGSEFYYDKAKDHTDSSYFLNGQQQVSYYNFAFFTQGLVKTRIVNIVLGARYDRHNAYGDALVPRVGFTKKLGNFHFKALYSNAFRSPSIENIRERDSTGMRPERTQVIELEGGYQITHNSIFTVNLFDITTKNPIVYYYSDADGSDRYHNVKGSGTRGIEAEYRIKEKWGYITVNYSFYTADGKPRITNYSVSQDSSALLAFANHKFNLNASVKVWKGISINPSVSYIGSRWAYTSFDPFGNLVQEKIKPSALVNLFINWKTPVKGLTVGFGSYNILDTKYNFIQPYYSSLTSAHAPLPGPSREYILRLRYDLNFKKQ